MHLVRKTYGGVEVEILVFLTSGLDIDEWSVILATTLESIKITR